MKKILATLLASVLALGMLASCGEAGTKNEKAGTFKIGAIGPVTGAAATYGNAVKNGIQLAINEINAAGGVNGMKFEMNFQDDEHNSEKAVNAYNNLMDWGMQALIGTVTSGPCQAVKPLTVEDNLFMITPSGSAVKCINEAPNAFRICFSDPDQGIGAADYIKENKVGEKVAVIYNSSDIYSSGIYEKFASEAKTVGLNIVTAQAFTADSANDFSVQIQAIKDSGADLVFLPIYYQEAALILEQAANASLNVKYFGCDGLDGLIGQLGEEKAKLAEGVMLLTPFAADAADAKTVAFTAAYKAAYNDEIPNQFAADAYDAVYTLAAALEKAGVKDASASASDICDAIVPEMTKISVEGVTGNMTWNAEGEPTKTPKAMVIKDGSYAAM